MPHEIPQNILIVGATGGVGRALLDTCLARYPDAAITAWSRRRPEALAERVAWSAVDITQEASISCAAAALSQIDLAIVATGLLHRKATPHNAAISPEKTYRALDAAAMAENFLMNAIAPALVAKLVLTKFPRDRRAVFAALSARVGSISDNRLGGWYSYRASKAALNQIIRTLSIELAVKSPHAICVGLHPGTVDTGLSKPFQANVSTDKLFTPALAAQQLLDVIAGLERAHTGHVLDWSGTIVPA